MHVRRLLLVALLGLPAPLTAQAVLTGRIIHDSTRAGIADAEVLIPSTKARTATDSRGRFTLPGLPPGVAEVIVRKIGFRPVKIRTLVFRLDTLDVEVRMMPTVVELEPIVVTAAAVPRGMEPFAERRFKGLGSFIDAAQLRKSDDRLLADLLRGVSGVRISPGRNNEFYAISNRANCMMAVWMDGARVYTAGSGFPFDLNQISPNQIEGIEIYRGSSETPIELSGQNIDCGTIVLWTRRK